MKKISLTDCVKIEEVLCTVNEEWSILRDLTEKRRYWKLKQEALDHTGSKICFGRGYRPVLRLLFLFFCQHMRTTVEAIRGNNTEFDSGEYCVPHNCCRSHKSVLCLEVFLNLKLNVE